MLRNLLLCLWWKVRFAHLAAIGPQPPKDESGVAVRRMEGWRNGPPLIAIEFGGKRGYAVIDTGSTTSVLDTNFFPNLHSCDRKIRG